MSEKSFSTSKSSGVGFMGLLTIAFIVLKLTNVITWSWVWVLSPLWIGLALGLAIEVIAVVLAVIAVVLALLFMEH